MTEKCSIIIVHTDEPDYLNLLLQSIKICSNNNDYETIIVDNASIEQKSKDFLQEIATFQEYKIKFEIERKSYVSCLISGLDLISEESNYLIFSHADNVVLSKEWLDFMIKQDIDNTKVGALCVGPLFDYSGVNAQSLSAPNYNFLFTPIALFKPLNKFKEYSNVGAFIDYQFRLQKIEKEVIMIAPTSFLHHFGNGEIKREDKIKDIEKFHELLTKK